MLGIEYGGGRELTVLGQEFLHVWSGIEAFSIDDEACSD